jgi:hypothetical protein
LLTWARWIEDCHAERVVKQEDVGDLWISTVFMGLDHNFLDGPPMLFETMIFRYANEQDRQEAREHGFTSTFKHATLEGEDVPMWRSPTWEMALEDHAEAVAWARERLS